MAKKSNGWGKVLTNLLLVVPSLFNVARYLVAFVEDELRQAKRGLITLFVLALIAIPIMIGAWFCFCGMAFIWLQSWMSAIAALAMLLLIHFLLLLIIGIWMTKTKNKLMFAKTRELFH